MTRSFKLRDFPERVERALAPLSAFGFVVATTERYELRCTTGWIAVVVMYDTHDGRVETVVEMEVDGYLRRAGLDCLFVAAGLGPAQRVKGIARTEYALDGVLESQAQALVALMPKLQGDEGPALAIACSGR